MNRRAIPTVHSDCSELVGTGGTARLGFVGLGPASCRSYIVCQHQVTGQRLRAWRRRTGHRHLHGRTGHRHLHRRSGHHHLHILRPCGDERAVRLGHVQRACRPWHLHVHTVRARHHEPLGVGTQHRHLTRGGHRHRGRRPRRSGRLRANTQHRRPASEVGVAAVKRDPAGGRRRAAGGR